jgi:hypothetical protein
MSNQLIKPAGTVELEYICWELARANGSPVEGHEVVPHFQSEEEARRFAPEYASPTGEVPVPKQLDDPCYLAVARCGYTFDQENTAEMHHVSAEEAYRCAIDSEFIDEEDGTLRCSLDCDECGEVTS